MLGSLRESMVGSVRGLMYVHYVCYVYVIYVMYQ